MTRCLRNTGTELRLVNNKNTISLWSKVDMHENSEYYNRKFYGKESDKEMKKMKKHACIIV